MRFKPFTSILALILGISTSVASTAQNLAVNSDRTHDEWIALGEAVHGGFGSHIALGIRIGQDALQRLGAKRREVNVKVTEGKNSPCACVADGIMIATSASPGQKSLVVAPKTEDATYMTMIEVTHKANGATVSYQVPASSMEPLARMNPGTSPRQRLDMVFGMPAGQLFELTGAR